MIFIQKNELVDVTWKDAKKGIASIRKSDVEYIINCFVENISESLGNREDVEIVRLGKFTHFKKGGHKIKDIKTGTERYVKEKNYISFKPSKNIKNKVNSID